MPSLALLFPLASDKALHPPFAILSSNCRLCLSSFPFHIILMEAMIAAQQSVLCVDAQMLLCWGWFHCDPSNFPRSPIFPETCKGLPSPSTHQITFSGSTTLRAVLIWSVWPWPYCSNGLFSSRLNKTKKRTIPRGSSRKWLQWGKCCVGKTRKIQTFLAACQPCRLFCDCSRNFI